MEAIKRLKDLLYWSDRLGSDESYEIKEIIKLLEVSKTSRTPLSESIQDFLNKYAIKVQKNESKDYVDLIMDNHNCIDYNKVLYYLPETLNNLTEEEAGIETLLVCHYEYDLII